MENYILITTLVLLAGIIYLVFSKRKNNDAEINELKESLTKVLVKMEEDNKQLRQNYIDEKINMEKLVLGIVKENTASQEKSFKAESENLIIVLIVKQNILVNISQKWILVFQI